VHSSVPLDGLGGVGGEEVSVWLRASISEPSRLRCTPFYRRRSSQICLSNPFFLSDAPRGKRQLKTTLQTGPSKVSHAHFNFIFIICSRAAHFNLQQSLGETSSVGILLLLLHGSSENV